MNNEQNLQAKNEITIKHPDFALLPDRLKSFKNVKMFGVQTSELAENGFFYADSNTIRCFYCGGGFINISKENNILQEHVQHYRYCKFLLNIPQQSYINVILKMEQKIKSLNCTISRLEQGLPSSALNVIDVTCKICFENLVNTVFLPCGHLTCCENCANKLTQCSVCRHDILGTVKVFF